MKLLATILTLLLTGCGACSLKRNEAHNLQPVLARPSLPLFTPYGFGHGCPIDGAIFTARHLVQPTPQMTASGVTFRDELGRVRLGRPLGLSLANDVAVIDPLGASLTSYPLAAREPKAHEMAYWWEYELRRKWDAMRAKLRGGRVLRAPAGHLILSEMPTPGASGSCVFNAAGEVIGIMVWGRPDLQVAYVAPLVLEE